MPSNVVVCYCKNIKYKDIKQAKIEGASTFEEVKEKTGAGSACGRCKNTIKNLVEEKGK